MPLYDFTCNKGHSHEALCKGDLSDAPKACPVLVTVVTNDDARIEPCGEPLERAMPAPASCFPGADSWRK